MGIGIQKQELLNRLSNYDYMTPYRRASLKRHGQTAIWLTKSTEFADWMDDPDSSVFLLSGKREFSMRLLLILWLNIFFSWVW